MYKQNTLFKFLPLLVFGFLLNVNTTIAQDITGSYSYTVKKDGAESTVKLFVYKEGEELYGRLRLEGDNEFGKIIEVNLWTMQSGNYTDFYYEAIAGDNPFTADATLFTLSGTKEQTLAVFSAKFKEKVKNLPPATIIKYDGVKSTFQIRDKAKSVTVEVKKGN
jgi:hypothetical protein